MATLKIEDAIHTLHTERNEIISTVKDIFSPLSEDQLTWKPSTTQWSVIECIEHLNLTNRMYVANIKRSLHRKKTIPQDTYQTSFLGQMAIRRVRPKANGKIGGKTKTMATLEPHIASLNTKIVIDNFLNHQMELENLLEESRSANWGKIKIGTAISWLSFNLGEAFEFITAHDQRHIVQARTVMETPKFPLT